MRFYSPKNPADLKPPFLEGAHFGETETFGGHILLQDRLTEDYGISLRHFNYRNEANLRVVEKATCLRLEYLYEGAAFVHSGEERPTRLPAGSYILTKAPEYQFRSDRISGARVLVFYLPNLERLVPDCDILADGKVYFCNPKISGLVSELFHNDCSQMVLDLHYYVKSRDLVMAHVQQREQDTQGQTSDNGRRYQQMQEILKAIHADLNTRHTIESLCQFAGVNHNLLNQLFKENFRTTFKDYLDHYRMEMVKYMASHQRLTLSQLAPLTGYSSGPHLCKQFMKQVGTEGYTKWCQRNNGTYVIQHLFS